MRLKQYITKLITTGVQTYLNILSGRIGIKRTYRIDFLY